MREGQKMSPLQVLLADGAPGQTDLLARLLAHHEESETTQNDAGQWLNVYGRRTPQAGRPLPVMHEYEQKTYGDESNATAAAMLRSLMEGQRQQFIGGNLPGRR